jgi:hypothetical protein
LQKNDLEVFEVAFVTTIGRFSQLARPVVCWFILAKQIHQLRLMRIGLGSVKRCWWGCFGGLKGEKTLNN